MLAPSSSSSPAAAAIVKLAAPHLLNIPPELLIEILKCLDWRDLLRCDSVCQALHHTIRTSLELQYTIELAADNLVDGPRVPGSLSTADRYALLLDRRRRWRRLEWTREVDVPMPGGCQAYELVGGVFAKTSNGNANGVTHLLAAKLPTREDDGRVVRIEDLRLASRDFAIDPSQDLLALVDIDDSYVGVVFVNITVHLLSLTTLRPHPLALSPQLTLTTPFHIASCFIQIVGSTIGMFFWQHGPALVMWDWKSAERILSVGLNEAWDFGFLGEKTFMLTSLREGGGIWVYSLKYKYNLKPTLVAVLQLPRLKPGVTLTHFQTHSSPFLGGEMDGFPGRTSNDCETLDENHTEHGERTNGSNGGGTKRGGRKGVSEGESGWSAREVPWEEWGEEGTRMLPGWTHFRWLRYVHGHRIVFPPVVTSAHPTSTPNPNRKKSIFMLDFNVHPKRRNDP
ncbi:hypothetical protein K474DRAFT_1602520, partial [Panus rudis PR-1116 ss-1]